MTKTNKIIIKSFESNMLGDMTTYELIGCNMKIVCNNDDGERTIEVYDMLALRNGDKDFFTDYCEARFFEDYSGFHMGTEDVTIEDLIMAEWKFMIDAERSDFMATEASLKGFDTAVKASDFEINCN